MYEVSHGDRSVILNNRDYKQLLRRFDPTRFKKYFIRYENGVSCICKWYEICKGCPLQIEEGRAYCVSLLSRILGTSGTSGMCLSISSVYADERGLTRVQKVYDVLAAARKLQG